MLSARKFFAAMFLCAAVCLELPCFAGAAGIDSLSAADGVLQAEVSDADGARLYLKDENGVVSSAVVEDGFVTIDTASQNGTLYLWDENLSPKTKSYELKDGLAYVDGTALPEYEDGSYTFDKAEPLMIVYEIGDGQISGLRAKEDVAYGLADDVRVFGLASELSEIQPYAAVLLGFNESGKCAAIDVLTVPSDSGFKENLGSHASADNDEAYENLIYRYWGKNSGTYTYYGSDSSVRSQCSFGSGTRVYVVNMSFDGTDVNCYSPASASLSKKVKASVYADKIAYNQYVLVRRKATEAVGVTELTDSDGSVTSVITSYQDGIELVIYSIQVEWKRAAEDDEYSEPFGIE